MATNIIHETVNLITMQELAAAASHFYAADFGARVKRDGLRAGSLFLMADRDDVPNVLRIALDGSRLYVARDVLGLTENTHLTDLLYDVAFRLRAQRLEVNSYV